MREGSRRRKSTTADKGDLSVFVLRRVAVFGREACRLVAGRRCVAAFDVDGLLLVDFVGIVCVEC